MRQKLEELLNRALPVLTDKPIWIWGAEIQHSSIRRDLSG